MLNVIHRYTFCIYVFYLMHLNNFFSEKGSVGFTNLSKGSMAQKRLRISGLNIVALPISIKIRVDGLARRVVKERNISSWM